MGLGMDLTFLVCGTGVLFRGCGLGAFVFPDNRTESSDLYLSSLEAFPKYRYS